METRNEELETASIELYQYMCNALVGSEKIVRYRRLFFKLFDETWNTQRGFELISSGSKSEGLDLHGSDFDLMTLQKLFKVYENIDSSGFVITIDTNNAQPGFALLEVPENIGKCCPVLFPKTDNGYLLSSRKMRDLLTVKSRLYNGAFSIHGPSVCHNEVDLDRVYCLQCNTWPFAAKAWLLRNKSIEWPPQEVMENITEQGVLLVPVGSKSSSNEVNDLEWRMSFSLSEKVLIHSFNYVQLMCYALLKIYLKEIVNSKKTLSKLLCSYYMKTLLFWILEETDGSKWTPENLIHCFLACVKRLCYWITINYIPNYFIPTHNMIDAHYELGNIHQADRHMRMLQNTVQNTESGNPHLSVNANTYLMRALSFSNDLAGFQLTSKRVLQMMKKSDEYKAFLKDVLTVNDSLAPLARMIQNLDR
ncbi:cyclic GMP-AMP synthase-like receptor 2 [Mytilus edulis]|uniref:cyclic GMP-AMP synthase-like receptor 2 n=1 Tax=Mytilus edulis TaxID=6550 RepID=UPI0039F053E7